MGSVFSFFIRRTHNDFSVRVPSYFDVQSVSVVLIDILCFLRFYIFLIWSFRVLVATGGVELCPRRPQEVKGSPELQNGGLRALEDAWDDFLLEAFFCQVWSFAVVQGRVQVEPGGVEQRPRSSLEVGGSPELQNGGLRANS